MLRVIHVFTHELSGLGEDGPAQQAVDHAVRLRLIPKLKVGRPCNAAKTAVAWTAALRSARRSSALLLSRQNLLAQARSAERAAAIARGGHVLRDRPQALAAMPATGPEVGLAMAAQKLPDARCPTPTARPCGWCPTRRPRCLTASTRPGATRCSAWA
jgi:transketolase